MDKCRILIWIIEIKFFIFNILTPFFTILTQVSLQVLFYICFFALCSFYIFILLYEISIYGKYLKNLKYKFENRILLLFGIFYLLIFCFFIILYINLFKFQKFIRNCPFYLDKLNSDLYFDRRCELYDTNYNSRYSYQYICSYDPSKEFLDTRKLKQEIKPDIIICTKFNELLDNSIINNFKDVYNKKDKYYCSRTNMPQENDYSFGKAKDCKMSKYKLMFFFLLFNINQIIIPVIYFILRNNVFRNAISDRIGDRNMNININNHIPPERNDRLRRAMIRIHNDLINLGRFLNLIRNIAIINHASSSNNSTQRSENPGEDIDFRPEKTINIIIENKKEIIINQNITNISSDKTNKMDNQINSGNINYLDLNSEEAIIRSSDFNNINNL